MSRTIVTALFENRADALNAVCDLEATIPQPDLAVLCHHADPAGGSPPAAGDAAVPAPVADPGAELPAGLTLVSVPGMGQVAAAGWLAGAASEAPAGSLIERMVAAGIPDADAHVYAESVRRGGSLVSIRLDGEQATGARAMLKRHNPIDGDRLGDSYRLAGWSAFDEDSASYTHSDVQRLRAAGGNPTSV